MTKTILALTIALTGSIASAQSMIQILPGMYRSASCQVEVFYAKGGPYQGNTVVEISALGASSSNRLPGDRIIIGASEILEGPGLCLDEATAGRRAEVNVTGTVSASDDQQPIFEYTLSCDAIYSRYEASARLKIGPGRALVGFSETSGDGSRSRALECGVLQLVDR